MFATPIIKIKQVVPIKSQKPLPFLDACLKHAGVTSGRCHCGTFLAAIQKGFACHCAMISTLYSHRQIT